MLSSAENLAIQLAFTFALPAQQAATIVSANQKTVEDAVERLSPSIRGRMIPFDEYLSDSPKSERDAFRLNKEVLLAQLQHQHDECLRAWTISVEHAIRVAEFARKQQTAETEPPKKPYVGDIRFLQLAKHLRCEMDKIETAIAAHLKEISEGQLVKQSPSANSSMQSSSSSGASPPALERPVNSPESMNQASPPKELPAVTAARIAPVQAVGPELEMPPFPPLHDWKRGREIPTIAPPPRKKNKYAGVNR